LRIFPIHKFPPEKWPSAENNHKDIITLDIMTYFSFVVNRYDEVANNVQTQETILNIQFVLLDCSPLKYAILSHCTEWQNKFTTLLSTIATTRLKELHTFLKENGEK
jgi:hypothetical protein